MLYPDVVLLLSVSRQIALNGPHRAAKLGNLSRSFLEEMMLEDFTGAPVQVPCRCGHFKVLKRPPEMLQRFQVGVFDSVVEAKHTN